jgi:hypothetical protein
MRRHGREGRVMSVHAFIHRRRGETKRGAQKNTSAPVIIPFPHASRHAETERARRKAARWVETAASDFIKAILTVSAGLVAADQHAANLSVGVGRYQAPTFIASFDPPPARAPLDLFPRGDCSGRVVIVWQDERGTPFEWFYERRTRALARLTAPERQVFIEAVQAYPQAGLEAVRTTRMAFAHALRAMIERDEAMMTRARP